MFHHLMTKKNFWKAIILDCFKSNFLEQKCMCIPVLGRTRMNNLEKLYCLHKVYLVGAPKREKFKAIILEKM